jgi:glycerol-3-phosphate acyltransferase PlsY
MKEIFYIFVSYLVGSIPFSFLLPKIFLKKNVFEIGYRKASSSNIVLNLNKKIGILAGILDLTKGILIGILGKNLSPLYCALCGVFGVIGHNWSIFLKGGGGRGIALFLGFVLILAPKIFSLAIFPTIFLILIFNSPLATIFMILILALISFYFGEETIFLFSLISLFPIFLKRLSPIKEISFSNFELIKNRLLYDKDETEEFLWKKLILKKLKK